MSISSFGMSKPEIEMSIPIVRVTIPGFGTSVPFRGIVVPVSGTSVPILGMTAPHDRPPAPFCGDTVRRMSVLFEKRRLGAAPALIARPSSVRLPLPTVLWFHGFTAGKAVHRPELATLAEAGLLAVGLDAAGHGERRLADFDERFSGTKDETDRAFYALVAETVAEVPEIVDLLCGAGLADETRIGAAGVSMGGMIAYGAATIDPRIRAAVALLASPEWPHPASPHLKIDRFFPTALLSITAGQDEAVPPDAARAFHAELEERYRQHPERLRYVERPDSLHMMTPEDWAWSIRESVGWLSRFTG